jgi:hypothetical protein
VAGVADAQVNAAYPRYRGTAVQSIGDGTGGATVGYVRDFVVSSTGTIHILDAADKDVKIFDSTGKFLGRFGRPGKGPGEFDAPSAIRMNDTAIVVADVTNGVQSFTHLGRYVQGRPGVEVNGSEVHRMKFGGALVATEPALMTSRDRNASLSAAAQDYLILFDAPGRTQDTVARIRSGWIVDLATRTARESKFGNAGAWHVVGDSLLVVADGTSGSVIWYRPTRSGMQVVRRDSLRATPVPISSVDIAAAERRANSTSWGYGGQKPRPAQFSGLPATWSLATRILVSSDGSVWIGAPRNETEGLGSAASVQIRQNNWTVFPPRGSPYVVELPQNFSLHTVRNRVVYGLIVDEPVAVTVLAWK